MAEFLIRDYLPSALVALVLGSVAIVVWRARADKANRWFAAFLMLVALNYVFVGLSNALVPAAVQSEPREGLAHGLHVLAYVCGILDPVALLAFAGVYPQRNRLVPAWVQGAHVLVAGVLLARLVTEPFSLLAFRGSWRPFLEAYVLGTYFFVVFSFLYTEAKRAPGASPVLPRGFLLGWLVVVSFRVSPSLGLYAWFEPLPVLPAAPREIIYIAIHGAIAWVVIGLAIFGTLLATRTPHRNDLLRLGVSAILAVLAICGVLAIAPTLSLIVHGGNYPPGSIVQWMALVSHRLLFPIRWIFFGVIVGPALLSNQIFDMDVRLRRTILASTVAGSLCVLFLMGAVLIDESITAQGTLPVKTILMLALIALIATQSAHAGRHVADRFFPPERDRDDAYWQLRRFEVYRDAARAAAEARVAEHDLERLRERLGLTPEDARMAASLDRPRPRDVALEPGTVLRGRYELERVLGRGTHGRVFLAHDRRDNRHVAVKEVDAGPSGTDAAARIEREVLAAGRLRDPHVLAALDYFVEGASGFLVTEHMPGGSLADRLHRAGPLEPADAARVVADVLAGLDAAHSAGILHRDVKPANVLFDGEGRARLGDFGVALVQEHGHTATSVFDPRVPGTLGYLPPEALAGASPDARWDVYAAGTLLLETLTGRVLPPGTLPPANVPTPLAQVAARARSVDPETRFATAREMEDALLDALQQEQVAEKGKGGRAP